MTLPSPGAGSPKSACVPVTVLGSDREAGAEYNYHAQLNTLDAPDMAAFHVD